VYKSKDIKHWLERFNIFENISRFTDIRKNPQIKLSAIILLILLMYFYGLKSFLALDRVCRKKRFKSLFRCSRKMVASDSTIIRALNWIDPVETQTFNTSLYWHFKQERLNRIQLKTGGKYKRIGIIDGTCMHDQWLSAFVLLGKIEYALFIERYYKRGKELVASKKLIDKATDYLQDDFPDLVLLDALYFNKKIFNQIRKKKSHLLVKAKDPNFREVFKEAQLAFNSPGVFGDSIYRAHGFDCERMCFWKIEVIKEEYEGEAVQIAHLIEDYPKRKKDSHVESWIITTDMELDPEEIREAAHLRWHIENNVFKRVSHNAGTKRFHLREQGPFTVFINLLLTALTLFSMLVTILTRDETDFKQLLDGIKATEKNVYSQIDEILEEGIFESILK
jgi:hypothetical protein